MSISEIDSICWLIFKLSTCIIFIKLFADMLLVRFKKQLTPAVPPAKTALEDVTKHHEQAISSALRPLPNTIGTSPTLSSTRQPKKAIGEILIERNLITKEALDQALEYQRTHGGSLTQYLLHFGIINETQLAHCLSEQFKVPYLPLGMYNVSNDVIKMIPQDIAEKHWVLPVENNGEVLTVVMIDPLDQNAIKELEEITGLKVVPFVGVISEILASLQTYYKSSVHNKKSKVPNFFVQTQTYVGADRRGAVRYKTKIDIHFPHEGRYVKTKTINVSRNGFSFGSLLNIAIGTMLTLEVNLPDHIHPLPIAVVTQVVRCIPLGKDKFEIGVKIMKISKHDTTVIMNYAVSHKEMEAAEK
ncbi:MAG: PilZ domain-containing protein [Candidatus Omnitrophica bacterium]|nr:PilZ domain-containing protein [Candidatus Omnitrophota bacterium]